MRYKPICTGLVCRNNLFKIVAILRQPSTPSSISESYNSLFSLARPGGQAEAKAAMLTQPDQKYCLFDTAALMTKKHTARNVHLENIKLNALYTFNLMS